MTKRKKIKSEFNQIMYHVAPNTYFYLCMQMDGGGLHQMWFTILHHCHHAAHPD